MKRAELRLPAGPWAPGVWQLLRYSQSPLSYLEACADRYGDPFTMRFAGYGTFVMLAAPEAVRDVFRGDSEVLHSGEGNEFLSATVGENSVLVLDGAAHARQRGILLAPLKGERMRAFFSAMQSTTAETVQAWRVGQTVRVLEPMQEITLRIMLLVVLGLKTSEEIADFTGKVQRVLELGRVRHGLVLMQILPIALLQRTKWLPFYRRMQELDETLIALIESRRQAARDERGENILSDLLAASHEDGTPLTTREIRDAVVTMIFAGHDTTSVALAWCVEQIVPRADVLGEIANELRRTTGERPLRIDHLSELEYLDAVIRESLRIRTVLPFVVRLTKEPFTAGGREYPRGVVLCPCSHLVHRREDLYPEPHVFRPERFLERTYAAHEWFPFGGGRRMCLGMAFAMFEMKVVLSTLFSMASLSRRPGDRSWPIRQGLALAPHDGVRMTVLNNCAAAAELIGMP